MTEHEPGTTSPPGAQIWRTAARRQMPWKNGYGVSYEVATMPDGAGLDNFDWRISFAEITKDGPFSTFEGVDRILVLIDGHSLRLTIGGTPHEVQLYQPVLFDGGSRTSCELPVGATRDLNIMTRRNRVSAQLEILDISPGAPVTTAASPTVALVTLTGPVVVSSGDIDIASLDPGDGMLWTHPFPLKLTAPVPALLAAIHLAYVAVA